MKKLIHFAMPEEAASLIGEVVETIPYLKECEEYDVWITGIGAPNIIRAISLIDISNYNEVYNIGYCGTNMTNFKVGDLVQVKEARHLDFKLPDYEPTEIPNRESEVLSFRDYELPLEVCFSSNRFVTNEHLQYIWNNGPMTIGLYDMEVAILFDIFKPYLIPLTSIKVVSDNLSSEQFDESLVILKDRLKEAVDLILRKEEKEDE